MCAEDEDSLGHPDSGAVQLFFFLFETGSLRGKEFAESARLTNWPASQSD